MDLIPAKNPPAYNPNAGPAAAHILTKLDDRMACTVDIARVAATVDLVKLGPPTTKKMPSDEKTRNTEAGNLLAATHDGLLDVETKARIMSSGYAALNGRVSDACLNTAMFAMEHKDKPVTPTLAPNEKLKCDEALVAGLTTIDPKLAGKAGNVIANGVSLFTAEEVGKINKAAVGNNIDDKCLAPLNALTAYTVGRKGQERPAPPRKASAAPKNETSATTPAAAKKTPATTPRPQAAPGTTNIFSIGGGKVCVLGVCR